MAASRRSHTYRRWRFIMPYLVAFHTRQGHEASFHAVRTE
jgi:hypothetical protein